MVSKHQLRRGIPTAFLALGMLGPLVSPTAALGPKSQEVLTYRCESSLGRRDITLFGNGTVRLREGPWDAQTLALDDLEPEVFAQELDRLARTFDTDEDSFQRLPAASIEGDWVETCTLRVAVPGEPTFNYELSRFDVPPLEVERFIRHAERLAESVRPLAAPATLPRNYEPRFGDILINTEGKRYRVLGLTTDGKGLEVESLDEPIRIFYQLTDLRTLFVAVEEQRRR